MKTHLLTQRVKRSLTLNPAARLAQKTGASVAGTASSLGTVVVFRAGQMLLSLLVLNLTYSRLSADSFITFNTILFALGMASALAAPSVRAVWRSTDLDVPLIAGAVNVTVSFMAALLIVGGSPTLWRSQSIWGALVATAAASAYCGAKAVERMIYAVGFAEKRSVAAFGSAFLFLALELLVLAWPGVAGELAWRLTLPAVLFVLAIEAKSRILRTFLLDGRTEASRKVTDFIRREFLTKNGLLVVGYTVLFTATGMAERLYPSILPVTDSAAVTDYLLVLAYGLAFQTLLSIAVDWARPRMTWAVDSHGRVFAFWVTCTLMIVGGGIATLAIRPMVGLTLLPNWITIGMWSIIILRFSAQAVIYLAQCDLIVNGQFQRAAAPWILLLLLPATLLWAGVTRESLEQSIALSAVGALVVAVFESAACIRRLRHA